MTAEFVGDVGAAGNAVDCLLETRLITVAGGVVEGAPFIAPATSMANCTATATPFSTVAAPTAAVILPVWFPPLCPCFFLSFFCGHSPLQ